MPGSLLTHCGEVADGSICCLSDLADFIGSFAASALLIEASHIACHQLTKVLSDSHHMSIPCPYQVAQNKSAWRAQTCSTCTQPWLTRIAILNIIIITIMIVIVIDIIGSAQAAAPAPALPVVRRTPFEALLDVARNMFPDNVAAAAVDMNILGIITFSLFFGLCLSTLGEAAEPMIKLVNVSMCVPFPNIWPYAGHAQSMVAMTLLWEL